MLLLSKKHKALLSSLFTTNLFATANANCNVQACAATAGVTFVADVATLVATPESAGIFCAAAASAGVITPMAVLPDIICLATVAIPVAIAAAQAGCTSCSHAVGCKQDDPVARKHGCGLSGPGSKASDAVLGPNKCLQLKSSVLHPSDTDRFVGGPGVGYEFHCANNGLVVDSTDTTCFWKCSWCSPQCDGVDLSKRNEIEGNETVVEMAFDA